MTKTNILSAKAPKLKLREHFEDWCMQFRTHAIKLGQQDLMSTMRQRDLPKEGVKYMNSTYCKHTWSKITWYAHKRHLDMLVGLHEAIENMGFISFIEDTVTEDFPDGQAHLVW